MEKKTKVLVYLPRKLYIELHERHLTNHVSYLVSRLLEEFLKTGVRISWAEIPTKEEQREYLERKLEEIFSRTGLSTEPSKPSLPTEPPKPPVQGRTEPIHMQERPKDDYSATKPEPVKEERTAPSKEDESSDIDILKSLDNLW
jgi:outer membrane biosynthesis protein TonB